MQVSRLSKAFAIAATVATSGCKEIKYPKTPPAAIIQAMDSIALSTQKAVKDSGFICYDSDVVAFPRWQNKIEDLKYAVRQVVKNAKENSPYKVVYEGDAKGGSWFGEHLLQRRYDEFDTASIKILPYDTFSIYNPYSLTNIFTHKAKICAKPGNPANLHYYPIYSHNCHSIAHGTDHCFESRVPED